MTSRWQQPFIFVRSTADGGRKASSISKEHKKDMVSFSKVLYCNRILFPTLQSSFCVAPARIASNLRLSSVPLKRLKPIISLNYSQAMSDEFSPSPPYSYLSGKADMIDLSSLEEQILADDQAYQTANEICGKIKSAILHSRAALEQPQSKSQSQKDLEELINLAIEEDEKHRAKGKLRVSKFSFTFGDYVRFKAYVHFLQTGKLILQSSLPSAITDEEYLSGIILLNHDLARYSIGRATDRDVKSVILARTLIASILEHLMQYDFRNGHLRRKYDGVKYALKQCETVLYELSVTGCDVGSNENEPNTKKPRLDEDTLPKDELESLRLRMVRRDDLRESLIKKCRDGQKAAKQAIYSLHREDFKSAEKQIDICEKCILDQLKPIVDEEPQLRYGSFANVLEEYAEAKLFYHWLAGDGSSIDKAKPKGDVIMPQDFNTVQLEPDDYLGGLCDLTGEIGRFAVKRGTSRDVDGVKLSLDTNSSIHYALQSLAKLPGGGLNKKLDPLRRSVEKLERMLYELSLVQATGRNIVAGIEESQEE